MYIGKNITTIRTRFKFKQNEFEEYMNCPKNQMGKYEREETKPPIEFLLKLVEISGVPIYTMYTKLINPFSLPEVPRKSSDQSIIEEPFGTYGEAKTSEEMTLLKDKIIKLLEENRELRMENKRLMEMIEALREGK